MRTNVTKIQHRVLPHARNHPHATPPPSPAAQVGPEGFGGRERRGRVWGAAESKAVSIGVPGFRLARLPLSVEIQKAHAPLFPRKVSGCMRLLALLSQGQQLCSRLESFWMIAGCGVERENRLSLVNREKRSPLAQPAVRAVIRYFLRETRSPISQKAVT